MMVTATTLGMNTNYYYANVRHCFVGIIVPAKSVPSKFFFMKSTAGLPRLTIAKRTASRLPNQIRRSNLRVDEDKTIWFVLFSREIL